MKTDAQLKLDVTSELEWDPAIIPTHIGVAVNEGVVTLTGHIGTYAEKASVERALKRVAGVKAYALELDVKLAPDHRRSDTEIAQAAQAALKWQAAVPDDKIQVKVEKGWITLSGEVPWDYQRVAATKAVRSLIGVVGVSNDIVLKDQPVSSNVADRIREALVRHAEREAKDVRVEVSGRQVTLRGTVDSWEDRVVAQGAAFSAPGVASVVNELRLG